MAKQDWLWQEGHTRAKRSTKRLIPFTVVMLVGIGWAIAYFCLDNRWSTGLSLGGLAFSAVGVIILVFGALPSENTAYMMSTTRLNGNPDLLAALLVNRRVAWTGIWFVLLGFLLQLAELALRTVI